MRMRSLQSGATLLYGPRGARPDLILVAQFLIDDLRAEGRRIGSLRANDHTLRLRLDGLELALALSAGPLDLDSAGGALRLRADRGAATGVEGFTDLRQVRLVRAIRQHRAALGVLLRRRGAGPDDLDAELRQILLAAIEAAPPSLVLWQPTGVLWSEPEFAGASLADLARPGDPLRAGGRIGRSPALPPRDGARGDAPARDPAADPYGGVSGGRNWGGRDSDGQTPDEDNATAGPEAFPLIDARAEPDGRIETPGLGPDAPHPQAAHDATAARVAGARATAGPAQGPVSREDRAARRSAGRLFDRTGGAGAPLPRLDRPAARLAEALRPDPANSPGTEAPAATTHRRNLLRVVVALWLALVLPSWSGLQAMLP